MDEVRQPRPEEFDDLVAHVNRVMREEVGNDPVYALDWSHVISLDNLENIRVVRVDDQIVSSAAIFPHETRLGSVDLTIGGINGVSTDVEYRRRGYASRVLEACIDRMSELGCHVSLLSTGVPSWYRRLGWEYGGLIRAYRFDRGNRAFLPRTPSIDLRPADQGDFDELGQIHHDRCLGAVRSPERMRALLQRRGHTTWVTGSLGEIGAYLCARGRTIVEYGGSPALVLSMLSRLLDEWDDPSVSTSTQTPSERRASDKPTVHATLSAPMQADPVTDALDAIGILCSLDYLGMIRIESAERLVEAYMSGSVSASVHGDSVVLEGSEWTRELSRTEAVKFIFGPERPAGGDVAGLPVSFHEWPVDRV